MDDMVYPKTLYKYMELSHAQSLLTMGVFRIGTLYDYRKNEHGEGITDINEATLTPRTLIKNEILGPRSRPELRKLIKVAMRSDC